MYFSTNKLLCSRLLVWLLLLPSLTVAFTSSHFHSRPCQISMAVSTDPLADSSSSSQPLRKKPLQSFERYLEIMCWKNAELRDLEVVLQAVAGACKQINRIVQRAQTDDIYGVACDASGAPLQENVQGEVQQKLDVLCNTIMLRAFCGSSKSIHSIASEEEEEPRCCADIMVRQCSV